MTRHAWTEEDVAYCAAQWASGIKQRDIAKVFGNATPAGVSSKIERFISKYTDLPEGCPGLFSYCWDLGVDRRELVKPALARFVEARNGRLAP